MKILKSVLKELLTSSISEFFLNRLNFRDQSNSDQEKPEQLLFFAYGSGSISAMFAATLDRKNAALENMIKVLLKFISRFIGLLIRNFPALKMRISLLSGFERKPRKFDETPDFDSGTIYRHFGDAGTIFAC